jgi:hypothetical protein
LLVAFPVFAVDDDDDGSDIVVVGIVGDGVGNAGVVVTVTTFPTESVTVVLVEV